MTELERQIMDAVQRFAAALTIPILSEVRPDVVDQIGTGTLFDHEGRLLLITARHLFDDYAPENLVIPSKNATALHGIGPYQLYRASVSDIDLAIIELKHEPTIARARASWSVLTLDNIGVASSAGNFVLAGYPSEKNTRVGGMLGGTLLSLFTTRLEEVPTDAQQPVAADLDLFFHYGPTGETVAGETQNIPALPGCSGASIWEYTVPQGVTFWTPDQCLKIIGVQSSYKPSSGYFRAKSWAYVRYMLDQLDLQIAEASGAPL